MRTIRNVPATSFEFPQILSLKVIPNAEESGGPALAQLVSCDFRVTPIVGTDGITEVWSGPGSLVYNSPAEADPWYKLAVREIVSCRYGFFNAHLSYGKILKTC